MLGEEFEQVDVRIVDSYLPVAELLEALAEKLNKKTSNIRPIFRSFDENKDGTVSYAQFRDGFIIQFKLNQFDLILLRTDQYTLDVVDLKTL